MTLFEMDWIDLFIVVLASFRITHLLVIDQIAEVIRNPFIEVVTKENAAGEMEQFIEIKGTGIRRFIGLLLSCYWCTGFWVSLGVVLVYSLIPVSLPVFLVFAVAGAAAILESKI